jgi:Protein of unknown function (DUF3375)
MQDGSDTYCRHRRFAVRFSGRDFLYMGCQSRTFRTATHLPCSRLIPRPLSPCRQIHTSQETPADTTRRRAGHVTAVPYVGALGRTWNWGRKVNDSVRAADLLELNRDLQGSRAIRLLAATNLSLYATLMERHLNDGAAPETELVVHLERDLQDLDPQPGLALIKSWAAQGWLHRIVDERHDTNVCYLTQDARRALDFLRTMRRQDTIATGGSITGIASRLKQVAVKVDNDPARIRKHIEAEIAALHEELDQLDAGARPQPDVTVSRLDIDAPLARHAVGHRLTSNGSTRLRPNSFTTHRGDTKVGGRWHRQDFKCAPPPRIQATPRAQHRSRRPVATGRAASRDRR